MKRILTVLFVLAFVAAGLSQAEVFKIENHRRGLENLKTTEKSSGKDLWQSQNLTQKIKYEGKTYLYIKEEGAGIYGKDKKYKTWFSEAYYTLEGDQAIPYQTNIVFKDREGKVIQTIAKIYDPEKGKAVCRIDGKEQSFEFKKDLIDKELLGTALQNYPFEEKREVVFHLLTNEPTLYKITVKYIKQETLIIGGELVKCHKLEMIPDLGLLNIFGAFVPKTYFWYKIVPPHDFVRYEGLESGLGTPYIVIQSEQ
ncbi:hypothetical protein AMJ44_06315 [candidate division WOR-1 bacterium DG_54_3]|uniref:DUF3108 domain-containing protein n=1 Tax=candidate division WOR-1 bacterium DG_54_3 TaxID=1703775 RepID=A0A0S7Y1E5_UNCSA|nr:MAG: hypothetical protein AMJ44_06315 [candidate division WOR-1 bacterium DG_54_3]